MHFYLNPEKEQEPHALPDGEVFLMSEEGLAKRTSGEVTIPGDAWLDDEGQPKEPGWYWWPCFPGCLPDGDPVGPFSTEAAAIADAREGGA